MFFPHKSVSLSFNLGNIAGLAYNFESKNGRLDFLNFSTNGPTFGVNFWFGKVE